MVVTLEALRTYVYERLAQGRSEFLQSLNNVRQVSRAFRAYDVFPTIRHTVDLCVEMSSY